jgi:hypothetical protein
MALFNTFIVRSQFKSRLIPWLRSIKNRDSVQANLDLPSVSPDVDRDEFKKRYKNLLLSIVIVSVFGIVSFSFMLSHFFAGGVMNGLMFMMVGLISASCYFKLSFLSWIARETYVDWDNRSTPNRRSLGDFVSVIKISPSVLFQYSLQEKK